LSENSLHFCGKSVSIRFNASLWKAYARRRLAMNEIRGGRKAANPRRSLSNRGCCTILKLSDKTNTGNRELNEVRLRVEPCVPDRASDLGNASVENRDMRRVDRPWLAYPQQAEGRFFCMASGPDRAELGSDENT